MGDLYATGDDPYTDPTTGVLKNKLGLISQEALDEAETTIVTAEITYLSVSYTPDAQKISFETLLYVHEQLFGQIYDWAGKPRQIEISKGNTKFCRFEYIESYANSIFSELRKDNWLVGEQPFDIYIKKLAHYYSELNVLHPFREGNGRATRTFISILAYASRRMYIDWGKISPEGNISACISGYNGDEEPLAALLRSVTFEIDK